MPKYTAYLSIEVELDFEAEDADKADEIIGSINPALFLKQEWTGWISDYKIEEND